MNVPIDSRENNKVYRNELEQIKRNFLLTGNKMY